ncbi:MAG TPA: efflux RND transporter periplasmic adaptor subunit [Candidatus Paceibacterota bacterium]|nr:efflux RND transporter periplasmic adaptor subunit [Verrucomicrobiota bacterium]HSA09266.1 efflux RND transporter periplasmic adaptor subunit [Candidatus Paceibacterota bacterium]
MNGKPEHFLRVWKSARPPRVPRLLDFIRVALALAAVAVAAGGCQKAAPTQLPPPIVQVMNVSATNVTIPVEFIGQLDSPQNVEVRARVEAFVDKMLFIEGTEVKQGDPLFALDKKPFLERLAAAEGSLAEAKAALNKYEKDVARLTPLATNRAVPQQDLDNALASVDVGKASVISAEARVQSAQLDLGYCDVRAPISGLIGAKQVSIGELVGKGTPTLLATISTLDPIWFYCSVSEVEYLRAERRAVESGQRIGDLPVTLVLADGWELPYPGKWVFLDRAVDPTTGTLRLRAEFPNTKKVLRPGMFARARVNIKIEKEIIVIPERAVQELQGKSFVWVIGADNKATQRPVKVAIQVGERLLLLEGLQAGERIVVEGLQKLRDRGLVQPVTAEQLAQAAAAQKAAASTHGKE